MQLDLATELKASTTLLERPAQVAAYAVDGVMPSLVALPASEAELAGCLAIGARHGAAVAPRGGGSKGDFGNTLQRLDLVISLERLSQVVEYVPADLTITAQAGIKFADLQTLVARNGQCIPIDPPREEQATIGGIVATGGYGPRRMAYGSIRDLLLGTRLALTDGRIVKTGGRVVKNVAGYDMNKLLIGSLGTLGIITEVTLKLRPLSPVTQTLRFGFATAGAALAAAEEILNSELLPVSLAVLSPGAARRLDTPGPVTLAVDLQDTAPNVVYQAGRIQQIVSTAALSGDTLAGQQAEPFWYAVRNYGDRTGAAFLAKVNTVIADLEEHLAPALQSVAGGHELDGIAYVGSGTILLYGFDQGAGELALAKAIEDIFQKASALGGQAVIESATPALKRHVDIWGPKRPEWKLLDGIKRAMDPGCNLNPGRYVGGI